MTPLRADEYEIGIPSLDHHDPSGWGDMETDYLRQELEEMHDKVDKCNDMVSQALGRMDQAQKDLHRGEIEWSKGYVKENSRLYAKVTIYLQIINEYQRLLDTYASYTNVKLDTNELQKLRKNGDLNT